ncbi:hypothetical protein [Alkaliphilus sp. B6464]|uniref:hypothetical protein n=1 Tax=Alkaliphilus sp. B6464 TaxID=2731219 RepID=UPI001BACD4C9|nr:hypothetical protein [Alkaliphilus sp. B6464]QUH21112.1 hypothetical protein HYG84_15295 [Alkaliphilus sp. B6464]
MDVSLKEAALEVQAPEQLDIKMNTQIAKEEIESSQSSINEIRSRFGLLPIEGAALNAKFEKALIILITRLEEEATREPINTLTISALSDAIKTLKMP